MGNFIGDLRYGLRSLARSPGFTAVVMATLALGIGANAAIFSVLNAVVLRPLPFDDPGQLVVLQDKDSTRDFLSSFSPADYLDLKRESRSFRHLAGYRGLNFNLASPQGTEHVRVASVTANFFDVFGIDPVIGRRFLAEGDTAANGARTVVLHHETWQERYGGDPSIIGRTISLNGKPHEIVGVAPATFGIPSSVAMWVRSYRDGVPEPPLDVGDDLGALRGLGYFSVLGRLAPGVTLASAQAEMEVMAVRLTELAGNGLETSLRVITLQDDLFGDYRPILLFLFCAVGLVLLIACANVANLLLARSRTREREVAIRTALGAGRGRLIRQLFTENLLLGLMAGAAGLLLSVWGVEALVGLAPPGIPRLAEVGVDGRVILFTLGASLLTAVLYGLLPAWRISDPDLHLALKSSGRGTSEGRQGRRFRRGIVVSEVALALLLLCAAGLLAKSLMRLLSVDPGFRTDHLLVMQIDLSGAAYLEDERAAAFVRDVTARVDLLPGVISSGTVLSLPFSGKASTLGYAIEGMPEIDAEETSIEYQTVSPGYFRTMGIPLLRGRLLTERDSHEAPHVVVINEAMARLHWANDDPIGRRIAITDSHDYMEIVGVVGDVRHFALERPPRPEAYTAYDQYSWPMLSLVVRTEVEPLSVAGAVRDQILAVDPTQSVHGVATMDQVIAESTTTREFTVVLVSLFTLVALMLALLGIYAVISDSVNQRVREIGIRMALGARPGEVQRFVLAWGLRVVLEGAALGIIAALALTRFMAGLLYGVSSIDPAVFAATVLLLTAVALLATFLPAYRASRIDPLVMLKNE